MQELDLRIRVHGWALQQVTDHDGCVRWSYTIGLVEHYGHPELTTLDVEADTQTRVLRKLVDDIVQHGEVSPITVTAGGLEIVEVLPQYLRSDLFGTWSNRYGFQPPPGTFQQVLLPPSAFCPCHADMQFRLDRPGVLPPPYGPPRSPNRAERRRKR